MTKSPQTDCVKRYKKLIGVFQELASILNTEQLLEHIVDEAVELCDASAAWILFPYHIHHTLILETGHFTNNTNYEGYSTPMNSSLEGWVFSNQQVLLINETDSYDHGIGEFISLPGIDVKSLFVIPITIKDKPLGLLEIANKKAGQFTQLDQEILIAFADQVAICIDNTHRFLQSDLVTELVHELHTPLAALNTALFLLQRPDLPETKREQISQMVHNEFNRLTELTTSFLDYARMVSGRAKFKPVQFDLIQLITESVGIIQLHLEGKAMTISLDLPTPTLMISADKDKIKQVFLNLLSNAIKYNSPGGNIIVSVKTTPGEVSFSIQDHGQGIPPEYIPRLFERFYRMPTNDKGIKGTGLGLTICKQIVEAHDGNIEVSSIVGQGSIFTVHLPMN